MTGTLTAVTALFARDARIARAFRKLQVSFSCEGDLAALQGDLAKQKVIQRRLVQLFGCGLRVRGTRCQREHSGKNIFWHLASTHLRYIWCPAQATLSDAGTA